MNLWQLRGSCDLTKIQNPRKDGPKKAGLSFIDTQHKTFTEDIMQTRIAQLLRTLDGVNHVRQKFFTHIFLLFLSVRGRLNFLNMARYGDYSEKTYRTHFETPLDFFQLNLTHVRQITSPHRILVSDASFSSKSGKHTPHVGTFWNGCVSKALHGLEISELAVVDLDRNTAFHLECLQTPGSLPDPESRIDFYVKQITDRASDLKTLADYLVYDGAAAKIKFVDGILDGTDLHLISKLRKDADLRYLYTGERRPGPGRPKCYDGKIDCRHLDTSRVESCYEDDDIIIYTAVVNSVSLKRNIRIAYVQHKATRAYVILFSTDLTIDGLRIYTYYTARFQIEFLFRDSKQYTGLSHCQARSEHKLYSHFNISLTTVSLAKAEFYADRNNAGKPFSMHDVTTRSFNTLYLDHIFSRLGIDPHAENIAPIYHELIQFGSIAA